MKRRLLLAALAVMGAIGGGNSLFAYTTSDLTSAGWTQVTASSITDNGDNYYMFVDANSSSYVMANDASHYRPCYKTLNNPLENPSFVWILEGSGNTFALKSYSTGSYFIQSNGWDTSMTGGAGQNFTFALNDGKYSLQSVGRSDYVGHWNDDGAAVASDGENIAANKAASNAPGFLLYAISKSTFNSALIAARTTAVASATKASPADLTSYIQNADWSGDWGGWARSGSWGNQQWGQKTLESWNATNVVVKQELPGIPNGLYKLTGDLISGPGATKAAYVFATGDEKVSSSVVSAEASANNYTTMSNEVAGNTLTADNVNVSGNTITVGFDQSAGWIVADNFKLYYYGPTVSGNAIALPTDGDMEADQWYYFDITTAANNYTATATTLGDIVYTTVGSTLIEDQSSITAKFAATDNSLSATRYYVKSSSANNLVVGVASYSYSISEAAADVTYIQAGNTVTVSYTVSTNDPAASLTQDYSGVTFGGEAITATATANGFTFTVPTVTANTDYTLSIPAGAIKYNEENKNAAQSITLKTPAVFDGLYYFYNTYTNKYMSRGGNWGTQAITDDYGVPAYLEFSSDGTTKVKFFDNYKYLSDGGWLYADNGTGGTFMVEAVTGGYKFKDTSSENYVALWDGLVVGDAVEGTNLQGTSNVWALETPAVYAAKDNATTLANAQAAAAAAAAGIEGITTLAALESELTANYGETAITITGAKAEKYDVNASGNPLVESEYVKETVSDLKPGLYRLTVDAFQRASSNDRVAAAGGANSLVYAYAGSAKTQIKSVMAYGADAAYSSDFAYDGKHYPNNEVSAYVALETGNYQNTVYVYVADAGEGTGSLTFGINNPQNTNAGGYPNALWAVYNNFTLTLFEAKATSEEKTALADAITAAEAKKLGFEAEEYAPYNNVAAVQALAAAKAIDTDAASGEAVVAATTALNDATWTENAAEVNAIYNGTFALSENDGAMMGWQTDHEAGLGGAYHARAFVLTSGMTNYDNLVAFGQGGDKHSCAYMRFDGTNSVKTTVYTYGATTGYTMPLKAETYRLTAQLGGWGQVDKNITINVVNSNNIVVATTTVHTPTTAVSAGGGVVDVAFPVEIETAGDYKLTINNGSTDADNAIVISNIELYKMPNIVIAANGESSTAYDNTLTGLANVTLNRPISVGYNTLVLPFDVTADEVAEKFGTEAKVYVVSEYESAKDNIKLTAQDGIEANKPVILKATTAGTSYEFTNKTLVAAAAAPTTEGTGVSMVGNYAASIYVPANDNAYVISGDKIYYVDSEVFIRNTRAYIAITNVTNAKPRSIGFSFSDEEEATAINAVEGAKAADNDALYNLAGQRVGKDYKGIVIKNGKKVMNK